jgi:polar amino acid transport system substrate-binding protein
MPIVQMSILSSVMYPLTAELKQEFAPLGKLRVAINYGNAVLAKRDTATGALSGVSVDLANEAASRLKLTPVFQGFDTAGKVVAAIIAGQIDLAFLARDPLRAKDIDYTSAYVVIEGAYLVRSASAIISNEQVDQPGTRIVAGANSAYDLFLTREIKKATLVRVETSQLVVDTFLNAGYEVAAGVKQQLELDSRRISDVRLLPGRFMAIEQAIGVPVGRANAQAWLCQFVEEMKSSGFVANALSRHRIEGAEVAAAA